MIYEWIATDADLWRGIRLAVIVFVCALGVFGLAFKFAKVVPSILVAVTAMLVVFHISKLFIRREYIRVKPHEIEWSSGLWGGRVVGADRIKRIDVAWNTRGRFILLICEGRQYQLSGSYDESTVREYHGAIRRFAELNQLPLEKDGLLPE